MATLEDVMASRVVNFFPHMTFPYTQTIVEKYTPKVETIVVEGFKLTEENEVERVSPDVSAEVHMIMPTGPEMGNHFGNLHGGFISFLMGKFFFLLIKDALSSVVLTAVHDKNNSWLTSGVTKSLQILYIKPIPIGPEFRFVNRLLSINRNTATVEGLVYDLEGVLLVQAIHTKQDNKIGAKL